MYPRQKALVRPECPDDLVLELIMTVGEKEVTFDYKGLITCAFSRDAFVQSFVSHDAQLHNGTLHLEIRIGGIDVPRRSSFSKHEIECLLEGSPLNQFLMSHFVDLREAYARMPNNDEVEGIVCAAVNEALMIYSNDEDDPSNCKLPTRQQIEGLTFSVGCSDCDFPDDGSRYATVGAVRVRVVEKERRLVAIVGQLKCGQIFSDLFNRDLGRRISELPRNIYMGVIEQILVQDEMIRRRVGRAMQRLARRFDISLEGIIEIADAQEQVTDLASAWAANILAPGEDLRPGKMGDREIFPFLAPSDLEDDN